MRIRGSNNKRLKHTLHIHALLLAKGGGEILDLGSKGALDILGREFVLGGDMGRGKGVRLGSGDFLDEGVAMAKVL